MMAHKLIYSSGGIFNPFQIYEKLPAASKNCFQAVDDVTLLVRCSMSFTLPMGKYLITGTGGGGSGSGGADRGSGNCNGGGGGGSSHPVEGVFRFSGKTVLNCIVGGSDADTYIDVYKKGAWSRLLTAPRGASNGAWNRTPWGVDGGGHGGYEDHGGRKGACRSPGHPGSTFIAGLPGGRGGDKYKNEAAGGGGGAGSRFPYLINIGATVGGHWGVWNARAGIGWGAGGCGGNGSHDYSGTRPGIAGVIGVIMIQKV